jgi:hypothetical protein
VSRFEAPVSAARRAPSPVRPPTGISAEALSRRIDEFLGSRGFRTAPDAGRMMSGPASAGSPEPGLSDLPRAVVPAAAPPAAGAGDPVPLEFVCEDDVRRAIQAGRKLVLADRAIVTPSARDLGEQYRVFSVGPPGS